MNNPVDFKDGKLNVEYLTNEWLRDFYNQVGRELSLARESQRETHNWVIGLVSGMIAAAWALNDAFAYYPSEKSFVLVLILVPIIIRFFVRSCLEYQIFNRWSELRNALDVYFFTQSVHKTENDNAMNDLITKIRIYYFRWNNPKSVKKMLEDNINLTYGWPLILTIGLVMWGVICQPITLLIGIVMGLSFCWTIYEIIKFVIYFWKKEVEIIDLVDKRKL